MTDATNLPELDARILSPMIKHQTILQKYMALKGGEAFILVNDHDPKPLYYQFSAEFTGQFTWEYLEQGPEVWRVQIGKPEGLGSGKELDVRILSPMIKHSTIFQKYHDLASGESFVLINDHDPKPLYYQFSAEYQGEFSWEYLEQGPEVWRVEIGKV